MARDPNKTREYVVIGLGRFGSSVALTLVERGYDVLGIDLNRTIVQQYADQLTQTIALDATDEAALQAIDISSFHTVIVSMAGHFENSILATVALKRLGVRRVVCKALSERQADILQRIGADRVVLPEKEAGHRLAIEIVMPKLVDSMLLGPGNTIAELRAPDWLIGKALGESRIRERFGVIVLLVKSETNMIVQPPADYIVKKNDLLVIVGTESAISRVSG
jgi:trk system potassium uptake protein